MLTVFFIYFCRDLSENLKAKAGHITGNCEHPWGAACGNLVVWPLHYLSKGFNRAVLGGWDPSARKFFKTDELSFTIPWPMFEDMLNRFDSSFLATKTWTTVKKKITRSQRTWGEETKGSRGQG